MNVYEEKSEDARVVGTMKKDGLCFIPEGKNVLTANGSTLNPELSGICEKPI